LGPQEYQGEKLRAPFAAHQRATAALSGDFGVAGVDRVWVAPPAQNSPAAVSSYRMPLLHLMLWHGVEEQWSTACLCNRLLLSVVSGTAAHAVLCRKNFSPFDIETDVVGEIVLGIVFPRAFPARLGRASAVREWAPWPRRRPVRPLDAFAALQCVTGRANGPVIKCRFGCVGSSGSLTVSGLLRRRLLPWPSARLVLPSRQLFFPPLSWLRSPSIVAVGEFFSSTNANRPEPPVGSYGPSAFSITGSAPEDNRPTMGLSNAMFGLPEASRGT